MASLHSPPISSLEDLTSRLSSSETTGSKPYIMRELRAMLSNHGLCCRPLTQGRQGNTWWWCGNGKPGYRRSQDTGTSVACLWRSMFHVKLDAMHLMLRIGREMNAEHPRRKKFLVDLSTAIFVQHQGDRMRLLAAREAAGLEGPPTRVERVRYSRRVVDAPEAVADRMLQVTENWTTSADCKLHQPEWRWRI